MQVSPNAKRQMTRWPIILLFFVSTVSFGQKEVAQWFFGSAGLDFNCNPPKPIAQSIKFYPQEGCSSISDTSGNILFYSDGHTVFDKTHQIMLNGFDIGLDTFCYGSSTQGILIIKQPLQDSLFYIFTTDCAENKLMNGFCYSIVNMNLNNGLGAVILKKQLLLNKTCEKLAAVQHANGTDVWILTHEWGNANFCAFRLTNTGLITSPVISSTGRIQLPKDTTDFYPSQPYPECAARGHLKFSPQGNKMAVLSTSDCHLQESHAEMFSFNNSTGNVTFDFNIYTNDSSIYYGASFSPNGNLLYAASGWYGRFIHQFDLTAYDSLSVATSKYIVYSDTSSTSTAGFPSALQIAPNGKIYNATNTLYLNAINNPNTYGSGCNFQLHSTPLSLDSCWIAASQHGLPNNNESFYLNSFVGSTCNPVTVTNFNTKDSCANSPISFFDISNFYPFSINNWKWDFGDPSSGSLNFSQLKNPQHTYSTIGLYQVKLIAYSDTFSSCKIDSATKTLNLNCVAGINQYSPADNYVNIFPNPFSNQTTLHIDKYIKNASLTVYNSLGETVKHVNGLAGQTIVFHRDNLPSGLYFVLLTQDGNTISPDKFVITDK